MSDDIKHECAISFLRLRQPLSYYQRKYGSAYFGYERLELLLEKQHNRGQDGAGIACLGLDVPAGTPYFHLKKSCAPRLPLADLLEQISDEIGADRSTLLADQALAHPFCGEVYLGHLRYGTFGRHSLAACQPMVNSSIRKTRSLLMAGNFNMTNTSTLFRELSESGYHPTSKQDSDILLVDLLKAVEQHPVASRGVTAHDIPQILKSVAPRWDGGFAICGVFGGGDSFVLRDANGIRPAFYYFDEEIVVAASERAAIQTVFNLASADVSELPPGHALIVARDGSVKMERILPEAELRRCVFERIYFSRGNDTDIHRERRALGRALVDDILGAIDNDIEHTVFSYIPNTALVSYHGMLDRMMECFPGQKIRFAQIAIKDAKFRTFIADSAARHDLFPHVYDVTYGIVHAAEDNLVVLDDSIVRGNTIRRAILPILDRLQPKRIVMASASPPILYPDCYGIDMASFDQLIAFRALISLLTRDNRLDALAAAADEARADLRLADREMRNRVRQLYDLYPFQTLVDKIARLLTPPDIHAEIRLVYQTCEHLRESIPGHTGDWYFTGNYPTPGGNRVVNQALVNFVANINDRPY